MWAIKFCCWLLAVYASIGWRILVLDASSVRFDDHAAPKLEPVKGIHDIVEVLMRIKLQAQSRIVRRPSPNVQIDAQ